MNFESPEMSETRTEPNMFAEAPRHKPDGQTDPAGEVGWFLQREREKRGLTLDAAGDATGIHPYHLEAIEYGDMTHMPPRLEALEMIAGYAQYLGFDAEPLVEHLLSFLPPPPVARKNFHPASPPLLSSAKVLRFGQFPKIPDLKISLSKFPGGTGGVVASALAVLMLYSGGHWLLGSSSPTAPTTEQVAVAPQAAADPMPTASTGPDVAEVKVTETPLQAEAPAVADDSDALGNFIQEQVPQSTPTKAKKLAAVEAVQSDDGRVYGAGNQEARVILKAIAPVWLRIEDAQGNVLMTQMLAKGDVYRVPNRDGLIALSRDGGRLAYMVDGQEKGVLGPVGQILVGEKLDVASLEAKN